MMLITSALLVQTIKSDKFFEWLEIHTLQLIENGYIYTMHEPYVTIFYSWSLAKMMLTPSALLVETVKSDKFF